jgi:hypothetical protein
MEEKPKQEQISVQQVLDQLEKEQPLHERFKELEKRDGPSLDGQIEE